MATYTVTSAQAGTALVSAAGTMTGITINQPAAGTLTDLKTPFTLTDGPTGRTLYSADMTTLGAFLFWYKPGVTLSPGLVTPTWPASLGTMAAGFVNGIFCKSCPANMTFTVTA